MTVGILTGCVVEPDDLGTVCLIVMSTNTLAIVRNQYRKRTRLTRLSGAKHVGIQQWFDPCISIGLVRCTPLVFRSGETT